MLFNLTLVFCVRYNWKDSANSMSPKSSDQTTISMQSGDSLHVTGS